MIEVAIITAPRNSSTLNKSVRSLRYAGFNDVITIYAEPGQYEPTVGTNLLKNKKKLGCFGNYHNALSNTVLTDKPYVLILSDDFIYTRLTYKKITNDAQKFGQFGYMALFTPKGMTHPPCNLRKKRWSAINMGWKTSFGGQYLIRTEVARKILEHDFYKQHLENYTQNQQIDHCIPEVCYQMELDQWYHNPSLCQHIGLESTIGHVHSKETLGLNFRK